MSLHVSSFSTFLKSSHKVHIESLSKLSFYKISKKLLLNYIHCIHVICFFFYLFIFPFWFWSLISRFSVSKICFLDIAFWSYNVIFKLFIFLKVVPFYSKLNKQKKKCCTPKKIRFNFPPKIKKNLFFLIGKNYFRYIPAPFS